jgi:subtilisin family serine protease
MRNLLRIPFVLTVALSASLIGCTQKIIVFKPSPYVDPLPNLNAKVVNDSKPDPRLDEQWNLAKVGLTKDVMNSGLTQGNANVKVAILSTGLAYNDDEFIGQVSINRDHLVQGGPGEAWKPIAKEQLDGELGDIVGYDVVDDDGLAYDRHGAGTAIAGIIGARQNNGVGISGIVRDVTLFPVRYINDNGQTTIDKLAKALDVVIETSPAVVFIQNTQIRIGGRNEDEDVVTAELDLIREKLEKVKEAKIPVVIGSGDSMEEFGASKLDAIFRSFDNVVVVTATDPQDKLSFLANFSFGNVHTGAPGEKVLSTKPGNQFGYVSGTAVAAAHITAALALAKSIVGDKVGYEKYVPLLMSSEASDSVPELERFSRGGNRLNIVKYLTAVQKL